MNNKTGYITNGYFKETIKTPFKLKKTCGGSFNDNKILIGGGESESGEGTDSLYLFDEIIESFSVVNFSLIRKMKNHISFNSGDNSIYFSAGTQDILDYSTRTFKVKKSNDGVLSISSVGEVSVGRNEGIGSLLEDDCGLVSFGIGDNSSYLNVTEKYDFKNEVFFTVNSSGIYYRSQTSSYTSNINKTFFLGGIDENSSLEIFNLEYDLVYDLYRSISNSLIYRKNHGIISSSDGSGIVCGGENNDFVSELEIFLPKFNASYVSIDRGNLNLKNHTCLKGNINNLIIGGEDSLGFSNSSKLYIEKISSNHSGKHFLIGGKDNLNSDLNMVVKYNPFFNIFSNVIEMASSAYEGSGEYIKGKIIFNYGKKDGVIDNSLIKFDVFENYFSVANVSLNNGVIGNSSFIDGTDIYFVGGRTTNDLTSALNLTEKYNYDNDSVSFLSNVIPEYLSEHSGFGNVIGGGSSKSPSINNNIYSLDLNNETWATKNSVLSIPRTKLTSKDFNTENILFISGGQSLTGNPSSVVEKYNNTNDNIGTFGNVIVARYFHSSFKIFNNEILIFGGKNDNYVFNTSESIDIYGNSKSKGDLVNYNYGGIFVDCDKEMELPITLLEGEYFKAKLTTEEYHSGAVSLSLKSGEYHTFDIQTLIGNLVNVVIWLKVNDEYSDKNDSEKCPLISLVGDGDYSKIICNNVLDNNWTQYNINIVPLKDGLSKLKIFNRSSNSKAILYIDDISII